MNVLRNSADFGRWSSNLRLDAVQGLLGAGCNRLMGAHRHVVAIQILGRQCGSARHGTGRKAVVVRRLARLIWTMLHAGTGHHTVVIGRRYRRSSGAHAQWHEQHAQEQQQASDYAH